MVYYWFFCTPQRGGSVFLSWHLSFFCLYCWLYKIIQKDYIKGSLVDPNVVRTSFVNIFFSLIMVRALENNYFWVRTKLGYLRYITENFFVKSDLFLISDTADGTTKSTWIVLLWTQQIFVLMKTSWIRFEDVFRFRLQKTSSRRLQKTSSRRLDQDKYIHLTNTSSEDVFKTSWSRPIYSSWSYVFKTSSKRLAKTSSRHLENVLLKRFQDAFKASCKNVF